MSLNTTALTALPTGRPPVTPLPVTAMTPSDSAHHWLILHGRYICVARAPRCPDCVVANLCRFAHKTKPPA